MIVRLCQRTGHLRPAASRATEEAGVALLSMLLLVALLSVLALGILDDIRFSRHRTSNSQAMTQARWYALGAESYARGIIVQFRARNANITTNFSDWQTTPAQLPLDDGALEIRLRDGGNCFNLNSLVEPEEDHFIRKPLGVGEFLALGAAIGVDEPQMRALSDSLVDWMDGDQIRSDLGAEDDTYSRKKPAYATGATLFAEVSEIRAVQGVTPRNYARLRPFLCALPDTQLSPININTLLPTQSPLIVMLVQGRISNAAARQLIERRPEAGFETKVAFWTQPLIANAAPGAEIRDQVKLNTQYFAYEATVKLGMTTLVSSALLQADPAGKINVLARRWTPEE